MKVSDLTPREKEVIELMCQGLSTKEIASQLYISPATVKSNLSKLFHKLHLHTRVEVAVWWTEQKYKEV